VLDLHVPDQKKAGDIQERVSNICSRQIIPALSKLCDELSHGHRRLIVDTLEIDIGIINDNDLMQELPQRLLVKFEEEIKKLKLRSNHRPTSPSDSDQKARSRVELLIHFFRHGTVPWWNPYSNRDIKQWVKDQFNEDRHIFITAVGAELSTPAFRSRLVRHFSDHQLHSFFGHYKLDDVFEFYLALKHEMHQEKNSHQKGARWQQVRNALMDILLEQLWVNTSYNLPEKRSREAETKIMSKAIKKRALARTLNQLKQSHLLDRRMVERAIQKLSKPDSLFSPEELKSVFQEISITPNEDGHLNYTRPPAASTHPKSRPRPNQSQETFIEINNAGLILLWTNLSRLFGALGYLNNQAFSDNQATHRAVTLLHFISTGQNLGDEYDWTLNKLLCGLSPEHFVPDDIHLSERETDEAELMMKAAIRNWTALKGTSLKGFRDTFLKRDGIITSDLNGWRLQVNRLSYDILLDKLPWPISVINLPWNNHLIHVQW